jgi:TolB-like protein
MSHVFISYARSAAKEAQAVAAALRGLGQEIWLDDEIPAHRAYAEVIEERLNAAKAVLVIWSAEAVKSQWVQSEADKAREQNKLVQLNLDGAKLPMPFDRIQCADLTGWTGDIEAPGWRKVVASIVELVGAPSSAAAAVVSARPLPSKPSIAILPFADMTGSEGQDYFVDGMVAEITTALSRIRSIFVIASSSAMTFKGTGVGAQEAARQLGVRYVLEGSVRKAAGRVRIAVQLIDASDGLQIWNQRFDDTLEDVFALQDKVAMAVAGRIEPTVRAAEIRRASSRPTEDMGSYDLYLRGLSLMFSSSRTGFLGALDLLNRALAIDPGNGRALGLAAYCQYVAVVSGWSEDPAAGRRQAIELAQRAVRVADDDAVAVASAAQVVAYIERDVGTAIGMIDRAIALNPGSATAWAISGAVRLAAGDLDLAVAHSETSMRLDPMGPDRGAQMMNMGLARFLQRRFDEAVPCYKDVMQQWPDMPDAYLALAAAYAQLGQASEARDALARYRTLTELTPTEFLQLQGASFPAEFLKLFFDSIALAERNVPSNEAAPSASDAKR